MLSSKSPPNEMTSPVVIVHSQSATSPHVILPSMKPLVHPCAKRTSPLPGAGLSTQLLEVESFHQSIVTGPIF